MEAFPIRIKNLKKWIQKTNEITQFDGLVSTLHQLSIVTYTTYIVTNMSAPPLWPNSNF